MSDIKALQKLPEMTVEEIVDYLKNVDGLALKVIQKSHQTKEMVYAAVAKNGMALRYANKRYWCEDLYYIAIDSNPDVYHEFIGPENMTDKLWILLAEKGKDIPEKYLTKEICLAIIYNDPDCLHIIPAEYQTVDIITFSIVNGGSNNILDVKDMTFELFKELFEVDQGILIFVTNIEFKDGTEYSKIFEYAIEKHPRSIDNISSKYLTYHICKRALEKDPTVIEYIPPHMYYNNITCSCGILFDAVKRIPETILLTNSKYWDKPILEYVIEKSPNLFESILEYAPKRGNNNIHELISYKSYMIAVKFNPKLISKVPLEVIDKHMVVTLMEQDPKTTIEYIPIEWEIQKVQTMAVKYDLNLIEYITFPTFRTRLIYFIELLKKHLVR